MQATSLTLFCYPPLLGAFAAILLGTSVATAVVAWPSAGRGQQQIVQPDAGPILRPACAECGVVASTRTTRNTDASSAMAEVTVRMSDGTMHTFLAATTSNWRPGARVILIAGAGRSSD